MVIQLTDSIAATIHLFTGRAWLLPPLLNWLDQPEQQLFLITGAPGTGKSMVTAWLAGAGPIPVDSEAAQRLAALHAQANATHFCIAASGTTDPRNLAQNIAEQLADTIPGFNEALLKTLPGYPHIEVNQTVGTATQSTLTGVNIESLNLGAWGEEASFNQLLREPLKQLYRDGYTQPMLLLIDALDEAATYTGATTIVDLLAKLTDLPQAVRILATTRPDPRILKHFPHCPCLNLVDQATANDIQQYAYERLSPLDPQPRTRLANAISQAAAGIFLYAHLVLEDLLAGELTESSLDALTLPQGLSGLYHQFLNRELGQNEAQWYTLFKPLLGAIVVAQGEGFNLSQLAGILQTEADVVELALRTCAQYLQGMPHGPFRVFHKSLADYLLDDPANTDYHIRPATIHQRIAAYYWPPGQPLNLTQPPLDSYGYHHLAYHLQAGDRTADLHQLLTDSSQWMEVKFIHCQGDTAYAADLDLAISSFADPLAPAQLLCLLQLHAARQVVAQRANRYDNVDLRTLVWLGCETEALNQVRLRPQTQQRFWGLFLLHKLLLEKGEPCADLLTELQTIANVIEDPKAKAIALGGVAHALAKAGQQTASLEYFADSQQWANQIDNPTQRAIALKELVASLTRTGHFAEAETIARTIASPVWQASSLATLGASLAQSGQPQAAAPLFAEAEATARILPNEYEQSWLLTQIVDALLTAQAIEAADRVARSIEKQAHRVKALAHIGSALANAGCTDQATLLFTEAETLARSIDLDLQQGEVLKNLTQSLAEARRYAEAERVALTMEPDWAKTKALADLAATVAQDHQIENAIAEAERIATFIQDNGGKAFVLRVLAMVQAKAGRTAEATQLFQSAGAIAPVVEDPQVPIFALVVLGMTTKIAGHQEESKKMFQAALIAAKAIGDEIDQRMTLGAIVADLTEQQLALEAEQFAQVIQEPLERAGMLQQVAISYALSDKTADAQRLFQEVEALAKLDHDNQHDQLMVDPQARVLADLSQALAHVGYFAESERVALLVNKNLVGLQPEALTTLSKALAQKHHFEEAERIARSISTDNRQRIDALSILAVALAHAGQETASADLLAEAQQLALTTESPDRKPWVLLTIATVFIQLGQWTKAEDTISTIEDKQCLGLAWQELATASQNPNYIAQAKQVAEIDLISFQQVGMFQDLAKLMLQLDQPAEAEEFFAAAEQAVDRDVSQCQASLRKDLAISHSRLGRFSSAKEIIDRIDRWIERDRALTAVARELSQVGQFSEAKHLMWAIQDDKEQRLALGSLALALIRQHRFAEALDTLGTQTTDDFIRILASTVATLEQVEAGLSSPVLSHVLHIIGWVRPDWQKIATILSPLTSLAPSTTR